MKKSELYKFIREEVEVVLTNEEAVEIFDLDLGVLLDEMMGLSLIHILTLPTIYSV